MYAAYMCPFSLFLSLSISRLAYPRVHYALIIVNSSQQDLSIVVLGAML